MMSSQAVITSGGNLTPPATLYGERTIASIVNSTRFLNLRSCAWTAALLQVFMSCNLMGGMLQRLDKMTRYLKWALWLNYHQLKIFIGTPLLLAACGEKLETWAFLEFGFSRVNSLHLNTLKTGRLAALIHTAILHYPCFEHCQSLCISGGLCKLRLGQTGSLSFWHPCYCQSVLEVVLQMKCFHTFELHFYFRWDGVDQEGRKFCHGKVFKWWTPENWEFTIKVWQACVFGHRQSNGWTSISTHWWREYVWEEVLHHPGN